nr:helix-turn-helix transcriptional regulator [Clostridioides sp.]
MSISTKLKELISQSDLTVKDISIKTGIPNSTLSDLMNEKRKNISLQNIILICDVLNCSIDYVVGREGQSTINLDNEELKLINRYRKLDLRGKKNIKMMLDMELKNKEE